MQNETASTTKIPYAEEGHEAPEATPAYKTAKSLMGMVPNVMKLVGHSGPAAHVMGVLMDAYFTKISLAPRIREMAYLTAARKNGCPYCIGHHTRFAKEAGLTDAEIGLLGEAGFSASALPESERAVIRFAFETTRDVAASDEAVEALERNFSLKEVVEIALVVATANFIQRIGKNFGAELEM